MEGVINLIAHGFDIKDAAALIGIKIRIAYTWANQWLKKGYVGLLPKKKSGRTPKLDFSFKISSGISDISICCAYIDCSP